jgi:hypothetical protein
MTAFRVLVTGSRDWDDYQTIADALDGIGADPAAFRSDTLVVVHGACPSGADAMASTWVRSYLPASAGHVAEERHPADWEAHGKGAGFRRNAQMVAASADRCLAFIKDGSRGASHCARLAEAAGILTRRWTA